MEEKKVKSKIRKVFLDDLPKKGNLIDWVRSIGYKIRFVYDGIEGYIEIINYDVKNRKLTIKYMENKYLKIQTGNLINCQIGRLIDKYTGEFKIEIGTRYKDDKRDITIIDRKYIKNKNGWDNKYYKYRCNKCGFECEEHYKNGEYQEDMWIQETGLLSGAGCSCCCSFSQITVPHINSIVITAPWMVKYFQNPEDANMYSKGSIRKINPVCPDCGRIKSKSITINTIYRTKSIGCNCSDGVSYGHKYVYSILEQLNIDFIDNYTFDWCKFYNPYKEKETTGEYDFVIEGMKVILEVDGGWHRSDNKLNGQKKEESKFLDDEKDRLAHENGYKVIRIDYDDNILEIKQNILNSKLNGLFNLSNIDWNQCEEFALSNLVKKACELKRDDPSMTTSEIGDIMKLHGKTVRVYLLKGAKLNWCNYDPKEEMRKSGLKSGKASSKLVEMFDINEQSLGIFESCTELERQSEGLFGFKLNFQGISKSCLAGIKYKGYTFKYVS